MLKNSMNIRIDLKDVTPPGFGVENDDLKAVQPQLRSHIRIFDPFSINIISLQDNF
jgi:hypothetical protein